MYNKREKPNKTIHLHQGESICIDSLEKKNDTLEFVITWTYTTNGLWCSVKKNTTLGKILTSIENTQNINSNLFTNNEDMDKNIDEAVLFCHKIANGLQILQDKLTHEENVHLKELFRKEKKYIEQIRTLESTIILMIYINEYIIYILDYIACVINYFVYTVSCIQPQK